MRQFWFRNLAIAMGLLGATPAFSQYPSYNSNVGPSSYPIQQSAPGNYQLTNWQDSVPSVPAPPQGHYGNLAAPTNGLLNGQTGHSAVEPIPMAPQYAPAAPAPSVYAQPAPQMAYSQQQTIAPGCTSCGNAPVSQGYVSQGYAAQPYIQQNCGPAPYAYSAPSVGCYDQAYAGRGRTRHLANGLPMGAKPYFFGGGVLIFKRIDDYNRALSITDAGNTILSTRDAAMPTMAGFELMGGRYFNCGKNAIAASYWGLFPEDQMVARTGAAGAYRSQLFSPIASNEFLLGPGVPGDSIYTLYDDATTHRLRRSSDFHNVEINLLGFAVGGASRNFNRSTAGTMFSGTRHGRGGCGYGSCGTGDCGGYGACGDGGCGGYSAGACGDCGNYGCGGECCGDSSRYATGPCGYVAPGCGSRLNLTWLAGVRYLQFKDNLEYAAIGGAALAGRTLSYDVATTNHLVGFQLGGRADYCMGSRANLYSLAKAGIYGNSASLTSRLGTEGDIAYRDGAPTTLYDISRSANQLAFLSELGAGVGYRFSPKWTATCGYRAIVASGVATAVGNVRHQGDFINSTGIRAQDYVVLHGLNIGALYNF